jgi:SAM-dependent methyltransferase
MTRLYSKDRAFVDFGIITSLKPLAGLPKDPFQTQMGVDILPEQVQFAQRRYGTDYRSFHVTPTVSHLSQVIENSQTKQFDVITIIEVIEHLQIKEIQSLLSECLRLLAPEGQLIITTPNYFSVWPALELMLKYFSDVSYEEQHITRFNYFNFESKLYQTVPELESACQLEIKTTSHFISPFLAPLSWKLANLSSTALKPSWWKFPLGAIVLARFIKKS